MQREKAHNAFLLKAMSQVEFPDNMYLMQA